ncbi:CotH kinase family protein [Candidatus Saccharibacteria bacterium]|nr:CotH kinase family protein [Candidatus Saccharibacteria bacterium]
MASVSKKSKTIQSRKWRDFCRRFIITAIYVLVWAGLAFAAIKVDEARGDVQGFDDSSASEIPVMEIFLKDVTLDEVHENEKDVKYKDNVVILDGVEYDGVEFKGRGNFSWTADKKSYRIKFGEKVSLLGMNKSKKWALVANSVDDSLMRNDLAQYLMGLLVDEYPFWGEFVELKIDGEELGVYYLIRTMEIGKEAVNLSDPMGVLMELDNAWCLKEEKQYWTTQGSCLTIKDAVADDNAEAAVVGFMKDFDILEKAARVGDYKEIEKLIDVESFAKYFIMAEITSDPDAYVTSWFMYKDGMEDKIHAGLAWDYDAAFGNHKWGKSGKAEEFYAPTTKMARMKYTFSKTDEDKFCSYGDELVISGSVGISRLVCEMMDVPEFREAVSKVYSEKIMGREDEILRHIDARAKLLSEAAKKDAELWEKGDFWSEVEYLKWWMSERMKFFEENYVLSFGGGAAAGADEGDAPAKMNDAKPEGF